MEEITLKSKIVTIILGIALAASVVGNICLIRMYSEVKGELNDVGSQFVAFQDRITNLQGQLADFAELQAQESELQEQLADFTELKTEVTDLQRQLEENQGLIEGLENTAAEQAEKIADLEEQLAVQEQQLQELQK